MTCERHGSQSGPTVSKAAAQMFPAENSSSGCSKTLLRYEGGAGENPQEDKETRGSADVDSNDDWRSARLAPDVGRLESFQDV